MNNQYNITNTEIEAGLQAVLTTVRYEGRHIPLQARKLIQILQNHLGSNIEISTLEAISPEVLASQVSDPWLRQQLIRVLIVSALVDQKPTKAHLETIKAYAEALQIENETGIKALELYVRGAHIRLRRHLAFNGHIVPLIKKYAKEERFGILSVIARVLGLAENKELAAKYQALLALPTGTLGRTYAEFIVKNKFGFPGQKGTPVEALAVHDMCHILGGYDTDGVSEVQAVAFQSGHLAAKGFNYLLVAIFNFHLGFRVSPIVGGMTGQLDLELALEALLKGARMTADLSSGGWNFEEDLALTLEEVRAKYNIVDEEQIIHLNLAA